MVVLDPATSRVVTEHSLLVLRDAAAWTARRASLPEPDDSFINTARQGLRTSYASLSSLSQEGFARIGQQASAEPFYFSLQTPAKQEAACVILREGFSKSEREPLGRQWYLARLTAVLAQDGATMKARWARSTRWRAPGK